MLDDFLTRAALAGTGTAILAAPLGCFVVWRRMAYFGETVAYSGLLGVALGFLLGIDLTLGVTVTAAAMALLLSGFQAQRWVPYDTLLGILAHSALAVVLQKLGRHEEAIQHARRACELEPNDPFSFTALSVTYQRAFAGTNNMQYIRMAEDAMEQSRMLQSRH